MKSKHAIRRFPTRIVAALAAAVMALVVAIPVLGTAAESSATVTITVNYLYESNSAMVAQPFKGQVELGSSFQRTITCPEVANYSTPADQVTGLTSGVTFDQTTGTVTFDMASVTSNITINVYYKAGTSTYTVNHWFQNAQDDNYTLEGTAQLTGDIDAYTAAVARENVTGFVCTGVPEYIIAADGTTVVNIYYDRTYAMVQFDWGTNAIDGPSPIYAKYGAVFSADGLSIPSRAGYVFKGWSPAIEGDVQVTGNITYTAVWEAASPNSDLTIVLWGKNANDDNYSYLTAHQAYGTSGDEITWNPPQYICEGAHEHTARCYALTCEQALHTHSADCGLTCNHEHTVACYGISGTGSATVPGNWGGNDTKDFMTTLGLESGCVYYYDDGGMANKDHWILYFDGMYYNLTQSQFNAIKGELVADQEFWSGNMMAAADHGYCYKATATSCEHPTHTEACYACGLTAHTHSTLEGDCYTLTCPIQSHTHVASCLTMGDLAPDANLWVFERSETVTIEPDGSTILNVYFTRTSFTLSFSDGRTTSTITAPWGTAIGDHFLSGGAQQVTGQNSWKVNSNSTTYDRGRYLVYIETMPAENISFIKDSAGSTKFTMNYYTEVIDGNGDKSYTYNGQTKYFTKAFTLTAYYYNVTYAEDFFDLKGFTRWTSNPAFTDSTRSSNIDFYYLRKSYPLYFFSGDNANAEYTTTVKYGDSLQTQNRDAQNRPAGYTDHAVFVGWYTNSHLAGEAFDFSSTMPDNAVALYAKWVKGLYTVETYTDESLTDLYTYDGYSGIQENIVYLSNAVEPEAPTALGKVFKGWFYKDENGTEHAFSFLMTISEDYQLYPKWSTVATVEYTVHYYKTGTTTKVADDEVHTANLGASVTERAKMGTDLNLAGGTVYFPDRTSSSLLLEQDGLEIIFYYDEATAVGYTVKYVDQDGNELIEAAQKTSDFTMVVEEAADIDGYWPVLAKQTFELTSDETQNVFEFVYNENTVTITYVVVGDEGCGAVDPTSEEVGVLTGEPSSTATAAPRYTFTGWYSDEDCTHLLSTEATYVPSKVEGRNFEATYYACFEPALTSLTITKTGMAAGESALFTVTGYGLPQTGLTVVIGSGASVTLTDLSVGETYTITENGAWSWKYTTAPAANCTLVADETQNTVTITNTPKTTPPVINTESSAKNVFKAIER